jgi:hypothetical protein
MLIGRGEALLNQRPLKEGQERSGLRHASRRLKRRLEKEAVISTPLSVRFVSFPIVPIVATRRTTITTKSMMLKVSSGELAFSKPWSSR